MEPEIGGIIMEITANTLSEAHEAAFDAIIESHSEIDIQTHRDKKEFTLEFNNKEGHDDCITLHVLYPLREPQVSEGAPFGKGFTAAYEKQFTTISPHRKDGNHATYTYWNRSEDYPFPNSRESAINKLIRLVKNHILNTEEEYQSMHGDGRGDGFKQVTELVKKLAADPNNRRGVIVTWNPLLDATSLEPPCMDLIQVVIRKGKVHIRVVFRSQDIGLGLPENLVGVKAYLVYITNEINRLSGKNYEVGEITLVSLIPHIYKKRDANYFDKMIEVIKKKKESGNWKIKTNN